MQILLIEDSKKLSEAICDYLKVAKIEVTPIYNGLDGYYEALKNVYDVIVLDVMLPDKNGFEILKDIRKENVNTPVLMLTAKARLDDKEIAFTYGCDDYLTKPFNLSELLMRLKALSRRKESILINEIRYKDISLDESTHELICKKNKIALSSKEYILLELLIKNSEQCLSKDFITLKVWPEDNDNLYNSTEVYISYLRKKLSSLKSGVTIKSIRNVGYILDEVKEKV